MVASVAVVALLASTFVDLASQPDAAEAAGATSGSVSGRVFENFTSSGWQQLGTETASGSRPVEGVVATAYDALGDVVGTGASDDDGTYTIAVANASTRDVRIEFSGWPTWLEPGYAAQGSAPHEGAAANDTSVQFVTLSGSPAAASGVDFALVSSQSVIDTTPSIASAIQWAGDTAGNSKPLGSLVSYPWTASGAAPVSARGGMPQLNDAATSHGLFGGTSPDSSDALGSLWGVAYSASTNQLITSATLRRMSGLGVLGLGGVYKADDVLLPTGAVNSDATTTPWFALDDLAVVGGLGETVDIGVAPTNAARGLAASNVARRDIEVFAKAGRVGIGGIATSSDGGTLFITNLHDGNLYAVDISDPGATPTEALRVQTGVSATQAIWAVTAHHGRLYIGYVDTGDTADGNDDPGKAAKSAAGGGMKAYVASAALDDLPSGAPAWTRELTVDLGYQKGSNIPLTRASGGHKITGMERWERTLRWNTWTDTWGWGGKIEERVQIGTHNGETTGLQHYSQPILSGLGFDADGFLTLGFLDRTSLQSGNRSLAGENVTSRETWTAMSNGDVLIAAPRERASGTANAQCQGLLPGESFELECGGAVGDRAARTTMFNGQPQTATNKQGPGRGEYYNDILNQGRGLPTGTPHDEIALGAVLANPALKNVATTSIDPLEQILTAGLTWFDERRGTQSRGLELTGSLPGTGSPNFQKSGGLGGVALLAQEAPVEIGNRVWLDADLNGRQDADEPAINGALVELWSTDADGAAASLIATRTTATIDGQPGTYYFRTDDPDVTGGAAEFVARGDYLLRFLPGTSLILEGPHADHPGFAGLTWSHLSRTTAEARGAGTGATNDSNPDPVTGFAPVTVGGPAENDHTFDSGWYGTAVYSLKKEIAAGGGTIDTTWSFDFALESAANFRGEDRLIAGGSDPQVTEVSATLTPDARTWTAQVPLPLGYALEFEESGATADSVTWSTPVSGDPLRGRVLISPRTAEGVVASLTAWNLYGAFTVTKAVTGAASSRVPSSTRFQLEYTIDGGAVQTAWVSPDVPFTRTAPLGASVQIRESNPVVTDPVISDVDWGTPTWAAATGVTGPDTEGWYSFEVESETTLALALTNTANPTPGRFSVTKSVLGAGATLVPESTRFQLEYTIGDGDPQTVWVSRQTPFTSEELPTGTVVAIRETNPIVTEPVITDVDWGTPVWSNVPGGAAPDADGWVRFEIEESAGLVLGLSNTVALPGQFSVIKSISGAAAAGVPAATLFQLEYTLDDGPVQTGWVARNLVFFSGPHPVGTTVKIRESNPVVTQPALPGVEWGTPTWTTPAGVTGPDADGWLTFVVDDSSDLTLRLDNAASGVGRFELSKTVTGSGESMIPSDTEFQLTYRLDEGAPRTAWVSQDRPFSVEGLALGTRVLIKETNPIVTNPVIRGIDWGTPMLSIPLGVSEVDGWLSFTITALSPEVRLGVENVAEPELGGFTILKTRAAGEPEPNRAFAFEYRVGESGAAATLGPIRAGASVSTPTTIPHGSTVYVREIVPADTETVRWADPVWSGLPAGAVGPDADGWYAFEYRIGATELTLTAHNAATQYGDFSVTKRVATTGDVDAAGVDYDFEYRTAPAPAPGAEPTFGPISTFTIEEGETWRLPTLVPRGTIAEVREIQPTNTADVVWGTPTWLTNGTPSTVIHGWTRVTLGDTATIALEVTNRGTTQGGFSLRKAFDGTGVELVTGAAFDVQVQIGDGPIETIRLSGDGTVWTHPEELDLGTEVRVREVTPLPEIRGIEWGDPIWSDDLGELEQDEGGWVSFVIEAGDVAAALVLTNTPSTPPPNIPPPDLPETGVQFILERTAFAALIAAVGLALLIAAQRQRASTARHRRGV
ncbi:DUF5979 domain-containing protein [Salinibacterium sp. ZJ70]|uniref:DUF5979 domain-containing protein n=1 Tax=Salinibacterium sp. ZJ70 TaxID=2708084 RepID=UPI0014200315|nr:DUF5979 domain-containing protein [Salinibacterium sp. ZJ70]